MYRDAHLSSVIMLEVTEFVSCLLGDAVSSSAAYSNVTLYTFVVMSSNISRVKFSLFMLML
jgi:hypothetical protein